MGKIAVTILFSLVLTTAFGQKLFYKGNGKVTDHQGEKLSPSQVREIYSSNYKLLDLYNDGRAKKTAGNVLLIAGAGLIVGDFIRSANSPIYNEIKYPTSLTYLGIISTLLAIPIKVGYSKKIERSVNDYNNSISPSANNNLNNIEFIASTNGLGLRFSLN